MTDRAQKAFDKWWNDYDPNNRHEIDPEISFAAGHLANQLPWHFDIENAPCENGFALIEYCGHSDYGEGKRDIIPFDELSDAHKISVCEFNHFHVLAYMTKAELIENALSTLPQTTEDDA